jgi:hypothetical protein
MFPKTITIRVTSAAEEVLVERALAMARDLNELAGAAPAGQVLDRCEEAAVEKGREFTRQALEQAVAQRIEAAQKKGRQLGDARAVAVVTAKDPGNEAC